MKRSLSKNFGKLILLVVCVLSLTLCMVACTPSDNELGKYINATDTKKDNSYIEVVTKTTCNLSNVWVAQLHEDVTATNKEFSVSSNGKKVYMQYSADLSLVADYNHNTKTISYSGTNYVKK